MEVFVSLFDIEIRQTSCTRDFPNVIASFSANCGCIEAHVDIDRSILDTSLKDKIVHGVKQEPKLSRVSSWNVCLSRLSNLNDLELGLQNIEAFIGLLNSHPILDGIRVLNLNSDEEPAMMTLRSIDEKWCFFALLNICTDVRIINVKRNSCKEVVVKVSWASRLIHESSIALTHVKHKFYVLVLPIVVLEDLTIASFIRFIALFWKSDKEDLVEFTSDKILVVELDRVSQN